MSSGKMRGQQARLRDLLIEANGSKQQSEDMVRAICAGDITLPQAHYDARVLRLARKLFASDEGAALAIYEELRRTKAFVGHMSRVVDAAITLYSIDSGASPEKREMAEAELRAATECHIDRACGVKATAT